MRLISFVLAYSVWVGLGRTAEQTHRRQLGAPGALGALADFLVALNPTAGWQIGGYKGRYAAKTLCAQLPLPKRSATAGVGMAWQWDSEEDYNKDVRESTREAMAAAEEDFEAQLKRMYSPDAPVGDLFWYGGDKHGTMNNLEDHGIYWLAGHKQVMCGTDKLHAAAEKSNLGWDHITDMYMERGTAIQQQDMQYIEQTDKPPAPRRDLFMPGTFAPFKPGETTVDFCGKRFAHMDAITDLLHEFDDLEGQLPAVPGFRDINPETGNFETYERYECEWKEHLKADGWEGLDEGIEDQQTLAKFNREYEAAPEWFEWVDRCMEIDAITHTPDDVEFDHGHVAYPVLNMGTNERPYAQYYQWDRGMHDEWGMTMMDFFGGKLPLILKISEITGVAWK